MKKDGEHPHILIFTFRGGIEHESRVEIESSQLMSYF